MTETMQPRRGLMTRIIDGAALAYLLFIAFYLAARWLIGDSIPVVSLVNSFAYFLFLPLPIFLLVALIARSRSALLRLLPVLAIVVVWVGPRFLPRSTVQAGDNTLHVMSNNVWHVNSSPQAVAQLIEASEPDVVFLQEVEVASQAQVLSKLASIYPHETSLKDEIRLSIYEGANITLSRYPFVISEKIELDLPAMPFIYRNVIEVKGNRIALYNIHLAAPLSDHSGGQPSDNYYMRVVIGFNDGIRNQQIKNLLAHLKTEPLPYIVAGDFNTSDFSVTYSKLAAHMDDSFAEGGYGLGGSWPVAWIRSGLPDWLPPLVRIDYIWHSDGLRTVAAWQGPPVGSDHLPLFAELALD